MQKSILRRNLLQKRKQFFQEHLHAKICANAVSLIRQTATKTIGLYAAIKQEVDPKYIRALLPNHQYFLPKVQQNTLTFGKIQGDLVTNKFGIIEPAIADSNINCIDCIIVPLVGFDKHLNRLGFGQGFYDRALATYTGLKLGLAYAWQEVEYIQAKPHDIKLDFVVTETKILS